MKALLGLAIVVSIIFFLIELFKSSNSVNTSFIKAILVLISFQFILTEGLSIFYKIEYKNFVIAYILFDLVLGFLYIKKRNKDGALRFYVKDYFNRLPRTYKFLILVIIINITIILFVSIYYPPNNWDSTTCWLARMEHWIQNKSLSFYPTHTALQNVHQPLSSIIFLNIKLITQTELFLNAIQFFFLIGIVLIIVEIASLYSRRLRFQLILMVLVFTLPMAVLQASSTKNDLIVSFFFVATIYFILQTIRSKSISNYFWLSLSIGFSLITKFSIIPFLIVFLAYYLVKSFIINKEKLIKFLLVPLVIVPLVLAPSLIRNLHYTNSILGSNAHDYNARSLSEEVKGVDQSSFIVRPFSVMLKYAGHQFTSPVNYLNSEIEKLSFKADRFLNVKTSDVLHTEYVLSPNQFYDEDNKNNFILCVLILIAIPFCLKKGNNLVNEIIVLSFISFYLLCTIFPVFDFGRGRYLLPLLFLLCIPVAQFLFKYLNAKASFVLMFLISVNSLFVSYKSELRSFPPKSELSQIVRYYLKASPKRFTYHEDYIELYNRADNDEKKLLDQFYDSLGIIKNYTPGGVEKTRCYNLMLKYNILSSPFKYDRVSHLTFNVREKYFKELIAFINQSGTTRIGLFVASHFQEYSLWSALNAEANRITIQAVQPNNSFYEKRYNVFSPEVVLVYGRSDYPELLSNYVQFKKIGDIILLKSKI